MGLALNMYKIIFVFLLTYFDFTEKQQAIIILNKLGRFQYRQPFSVLYGTNWLT